MVAGSMPRVANTRATVSPILLFGVLAPAVRPTRTAPLPSQPAVFAAESRQRVAREDRATLGIDAQRVLHVEGPHALGAQRGQ